MDQIHTLDNTFGAALIGVFLASMLYGVSCSQVFYYFNTYSERDGLPTKALVLTAFLSDTVHQALICHTMYHYLVKGYFDPHLLGELVWSLLVEVIFNGITALLVQSFFAVRIWKFSEGNVYLTATLAAFILGEFAVVIAYVVKSLPMTTFQQLATLMPLSMAVNALAAIGDFLITFTCCILLHRARTKLPTVRPVIDLLILFSLQTGMVTTLCAIGSLVSISASPKTFVYIGFYFILGRLYCNSLLATLNVRKAIRSRAESRHDIGLQHISASTPVQITIHNSISHHRSPTPGPMEITTTLNLGNRGEGRDKGHAV